MEVQERGRLQGIAATLLALAFLAERAAGRSFPVRFLVLSILCRAETIARAFVAGAIVADCPDLLTLAEPPGPRGGAADAAILALRLRMLAAVLGVHSDADDRFAGRSSGEEPRRGGAPCLPLILVVRLPARHRPSRPHDTS